MRKALMMFILTAALRSIGQEGTADLKLYWNGEHEDNCLVATRESENEAIAAGYSFVRVEGRLLTYPLPGTTPLWLMWGEGQRDYQTLSTCDGMANAINGGYRIVRIEGYVYRQPRPGTTPLRLFWSGRREDNNVVATLEGYDDAVAAGYTFVNDQGYLMSEPPAQEGDWCGDVFKGQFVGCAAGLDCHTRISRGCDGWWIFRTCDQLASVDMFCQ